MGNVLNSWWALVHDSHTARILVEMGALFLSILPGLVIGVAVSSALVAWWPMEQARSWIRLEGWGALFGATLLGVLSPFCSYLAIPIAAALILGGVQPAPVFAFLCSTPLMNPTLFAMTWSVFGWPMAVARVAAALGMGIAGGWLASRFSETLLRAIERQSPGSSLALQPPGGDIAFSRRWLRSSLHLGGFALKYVLLGLVIAAAVKELIPMRWVEAMVGRGYGYSILVGALLGVPLYACGGGTIPLILVLTNMGMSPGAALAFFVAGPATTLPTLAVMRITAGTAVTVVYVTLALFVSVLAGILFQAVQ